MIFFRKNLNAGSNLCKDWSRIDAAPLKVALKGQQVLAVVLLEGVGPTGAGPDPELGRDVLPGLLVGALNINMN